MGLSPSPELQQMLGLDPEQPTLDGGGATQPPQLARQSEHQFSFDGRLRVVVGCHGHFERCIVLGIFQRVDHGFCSEPVTKRILARFSLALFGDRSGAETRIAAVGLDLPEGGHPASGRTIGFVSSFCDQPARRLPLIKTCPVLSARCAPSMFAVAEANACVLAQSFAATGNGSIPWLSHQARSSPRRWSSRWCSRQIGTVKRSLTFRAIARCSANLMWWGSEGVRPQTRHGWAATNFRCSRSRSRTGLPITVTSLGSLCRVSSCPFAFRLCGSEAGAKSPT